MALYRTQHGGGIAMPPRAWDGVALEDNSSRIDINYGRRGDYLYLLYRYDRGLGRFWPPQEGIARLDPVGDAPDENPEAWDHLS